VFKTLTGVRVHCLKTYGTTNLKSNWVMKPLAKLKDGVPDMEDTCATYTRLEVK